jgi:hypothetical protein
MYEIQITTQTLYPNIKVGLKPLQCTPTILELKIKIATKHKPTHIQIHVKIYEIQPTIVKRKPH